MYKMTVYSMYGHDLMWCKILRVETIPEAVALSMEKMKVFLGSEKVSFSRVKKGRYNVFMNRNVIGELLLSNLSKGN